jgi:hypothetical protein
MTATRISLLLLLSFCFCTGIVNAATSLPAGPLTGNDTLSLPPAFNDGGKTADSLQKAYNCETIEYENWEDDDATDSTLTVCLINSTKVPLHQPDDSVDHLVNIAALFKKAVKHPERYTGYYIIFVKESKAGIFSTRSHTMGGVIPVSRL